MDYNSLLNEGMTEKYAKKLIERFAEDYKIIEYNQDYVKWAHSIGFSAYFAYVYGLNENNYKDYVSDHLCYLLYPHNDWESIWVNDKLTMRYILDRIDNGKCTPQYYYYVDKKRGLIPLPDYPRRNREITTSNSGTELLDLLKEKRTLACKPNNGALSKGFIKLQYVGDTVLFGSEEIRPCELSSRVADLPNYVITEYIHSLDSLKIFTEGTPVIKVWTLNPTGKNAEIVGCVIRLNDIVIDYGVPFDADNYMIYAKIDMDSGEITDYLKVHHYGTVKIHNHKGFDLNGFCRLPNVNSFVDSVLSIANYLGLIECMEFDFIPSESGYKLIEINSFICEIGMQLYKPFSIDTPMGKFFNHKLEMLRQSSKEEIIRRNKLKQ